MSILASSCAGVPEKPDVEVCVLFVADRYALCAGGRIGKEPLERPLEDMERAVSFPVSSWVKYQAYVDELELMVRRK
jgi:hypothetical protein